MNRGSSRQSFRTRPQARGFNEAPIHESGKFEEPHVRIRARKGFNEAPIHESGKCR